MERLASVVNSDLANTLGNLLQRISSKRLLVSENGLVYHKDLFPFLGQEKSNTARASEQDYALIKSLHELPGTVHYNDIVCKHYHVLC